jgi:hypothetical protein
MAEAVQLEHRTVAALAAALEDLRRPLRTRERMARELFCRGQREPHHVAREVTPLLESRLRDARLHACEILAELSAPLPIDRFVRLLSDRDAEVRAQAARAIGLRRARSPGLSLALVGAAADLDPRVQITALAALAVTVPSPPLFEPLGAALVSDRYSVSRGAVAILRGASAETCRCAAALLLSREPLAQRGALAVLHATDASLDGLLSTLLLRIEPGHDAFVRRAAARALGHVRTPSRALVDALVRLGRDWDGSLRVTAAVSLGQLAAREGVDGRAHRAYASAVRRIGSDEVPDLAAALRGAGSPIPPEGPLLTRLSSARRFAQLDLADALLAPRRAVRRVHGTDRGGIAVPLDGDRLDDALENVGESDRPRVGSAMLAFTRHDDPAVRAGCAVFAAALDDGIGVAITLQHIADADPEPAVRAVARSLLDRAE